MKKLRWVSFSLTFLLILFFNNAVTFAQVDNSTGTVLPKLSQESIDCEGLLNDFEAGQGFTTKSSDGKQNFRETDTLACGIKTGRISLKMVPYFIKYISNFVLGLVGLVSLLFIVIGGLFYTTSGLTENKDKGKKFITNALLGLVVSVMAWSIVNVIIRAVTG